MSGFGFAEVSGGGNTGTRNPLLSASGTQVARTTAGDFYTYTLPANSLTVNGDYIVIETGFTFSPDPRGGTIDITIGGLVAASHPFANDPVNEDALITITAIRTASNALRVGAVKSWSYGTTNYAIYLSTASIAVDLTVSNTIAITASSITNGTATSQYYYIASFLTTG